MTRTLDLTGELLAQLEWHWTTQLRPRLDGLTDDEYLWEPAQPSWNVHPFLSLIVQDVASLFGVRDSASCPPKLPFGRMSVSFE